MSPHVRSKPASPLVLFSRLEFTPFFLAFNYPLYKLIVRFLSQREIKTLLLDSHRLFQTRPYTSITQDEYIPRNTKLPSLFNKILDSEGSILIGAMSGRSIPAISPSFQTWPCQSIAPFGVVFAHPPKKFIFNNLKKKIWHTDITKWFTKYDILLGETCESVFARGERWPTLIIYVVRN